MNSAAQDITWDAAEIANWNSWEVNIAIVCACLTTMKPLLSRFFPGLISPSHSNSQSSLPDEADISGARGPRHRRLHGDSQLSEVELGNGAGSISINHSKEKD